MMAGSSLNWFLGQKRMERFGTIRGSSPGRLDRLHAGRFSVVSRLRSVTDNSPDFSSRNFSFSSFSLSIAGLFFLNGRVKCCCRSRGERLPVDCGEQRGHLIFVIALASSMFKKRLHPRRMPGEYLQRLEMVVSQLNRGKQSGTFHRVLSSSYPFKIRTT